MMQQPILQTAMPVAMGQSPYTMVQAHASMPPPPPGMMYLVPIPQGQQYASTNPNQATAKVEPEPQQNLNTSIPASSQQVSEIGTGHTEA
jgi:hypothetical protein